MNWRDAGSPVGAQGVLLDPTYLSGFIWGENVGWINLGDDTHLVAFRYPGDFNDDGLLNFFDVQAFLNFFAAGCGL